MELIKRWRHFELMRVDFAKLAVWIAAGLYGF
jgi:hypothetical protein